MVAAGSPKPWRVDSISTSRAKNEIEMKRKPKHKL